MTRPARLLLASASPARLATLRSAGVEPSVRVSGVDEDAALRSAQSRYGTLDPADVALVLARAKAEAVVESLLGEDSADAVELVLGCDSVLELDGSAHGKPSSAQEARDRWRAMSGRRGVLHTGHWLIDLRPDGTGATLGATGSTAVHFARLSPRRSTRTSPRANRCRSPARSPSTDWAARMSIASRATTTTSSASACRCCAGCSPRSACPGTLSSRADAPRVVVTMGTAGTGATSCGDTKVVSRHRRGPVRHII